MIMLQKCMCVRERERRGEIVCVLRWSFCCGIFPLYSFTPLAVVFSAALDEEKERAKKQCKMCTKSELGIQNCVRLRLRRIRWKNTLIEQEAWNNECFQK